MTTRDPGNRTALATSFDPQWKPRPPRRPRALHPRLLAAALFVGLLAPAALPLTAVAATPATDGPGALSHFDLARKDCLGTAQNTSSKVWYTVADGVLSDVYYPTIDNTNVETLQFVVTDGSTFTDLATRDMTYTVSSIGPSGMACQVTSTAKSGKYRLITSYITDPRHNSVLIQSRLIPLIGGNYHVYVRFDPTVNGNGGGGSGNGGADSATVDTSTGHNIAVSYDTVTATQAANNDYRQPVYAALDGPFGQVESGFAGAASDGLTQLDASHALTGSTTAALNGNVVQTASVNPGGFDGRFGGQFGRFGSQFTLALGFGSTQAGAVSTAESSLHGGFGLALGLYQLGWTLYDAHLNRPPAFVSGLSAAQVRAADSLYYVSANVLKASEDKTFPGAISASIASPWGQAISAGDPANTYFGSYREVFARDLYEAWTGLIADGDLATARDAVNFLFLRQQQADGSMPRNSLLNGKTAPDSFNTQLDETAYPILMADQMGMFGSSLYQSHIRPAAMFLISPRPELRRPSAGRSRAATRRPRSRLRSRASWPPRTSPNITATPLPPRCSSAWRTTTSARSRAGRSRRTARFPPARTSSACPRRAIPTRPSATTWATAARRSTSVRWSTPASSSLSDSASCLPTTRRSPRPSRSSTPRSRTRPRAAPAGIATTATATATTRPPERRGRRAGRGPVISGRHSPWSAANTTWSPARRPSAASLVPSFSGFASGVGLIPEQVWELPNLAASPYGTDPTTASIGFVNGQAAGSAAPLTWSAGAYVRLLADIKARPPARHARRSRPRGTSPTLRDRRRSRSPRRRT